MSSSSDADEENKGETKSGNEEVTNSSYDDVPTEQQMSKPPACTESVTPSSSSSSSSLPPSDEEMRKLLKPTPTEDEVLKLLKEHYCESENATAADETDKNSENDNDGGAAAVRLVNQLDSYDDANFLVELKGTRYLLKIHNGVESRDYLNVKEEASSSMLSRVRTTTDDGNYNGNDHVEMFYQKGYMKSVIHLQNAMMELLNEHDVATNLPIVPRTNLQQQQQRKKKSLEQIDSPSWNSNTTNSSNRPCPLIVANLPVQSSAHSPAPCVVRLLSWLPGRSMSSLPFLALETLCDAGRFLAKLDKILDILAPNSLSGVLQKSFGSSAALGRRGSHLNLHYMKDDFNILKNLELFRQSHVDDDSEDDSDNDNNEQDGDKKGELNKKSTAAAPPSAGFSNRNRQPSTAAATATSTGSAAACLDESLLIPARRYHQWDTKNTADLSKFVHCISNNTKRKNIIYSIINAFQKQILDSGVSQYFRKGIIHGDFNDANILVDTTVDGAARVSGVIDFGDSVESWRVLDISVAMAYAMLSSYGKGQRSISAAAAMLRGYHSVYPLLQLEIEHLPLLIACRLACSVTLGAYSYQQNPENKYLLLHAEPAWNTLEMLWGCHDDARRHEKLLRAISRVFEQACLYNDSKSLSCYDLAVPDPGVADLLHSVRVVSKAADDEDDDDEKDDGNNQIMAAVTNFKRKAASEAVVGSPKSPKKLVAVDLSEFGEGGPAVKKQKTDGGDGSAGVSNSDDAGHTITLVCDNVIKLNDFKDVLLSDPYDVGFELVSCHYSLPEIQGEPIAVAIEKCRCAAKEVGGPVIVEDTSFCFNSLKGLPGPFIRCFLDKLGHEGLNKMLDGFEDKTAYAQSIVAYSDGPGNDPAIFVGTTNGKIVPPRYSSGKKKNDANQKFMMDAIFEPVDNGGGRTFAEMTAEEKKSISYRCRALQQMKCFLKSKFSKT